MDSPLVSIITPSYNQAQYLEETIRSISSQTYSKIEHIIIDGGSKDNSVDIIKKHENRLAYWCSEPDKGQTDAINKGLTKAKGDILCWLNSDDLYFPDSIERVAAAFNHFPADVIYGDYTLITSQGVPFLKRKEIPFELDLLLYGVNFIGQPSSFFKREMIERFGYLDAGLRYAMDYEYWLRLAHGGATFRHIKECLSLYRYHESSKTVGSKSDFGSEMLHVRQKYSGKSISQLRWLGYAARLKRQFTKLRYRGTIDFLGGNLNRYWYKIVESSNR